MEHIAFEVAPFCADVTQIGFVGEQKARMAADEQRGLGDPLFDKGARTRGLHGSGERGERQCAISGGRPQREKIRMQHLHAGRSGQRGRLSRTAIATRLFCHGTSASAAS